MKKTISRKYLCGNCYNTIDMNISFNTDDIEFIDSDQIYNLVHYIDAKCPKCGEISEFFQCDEKMIDIITLLNKYGFETIYNCQGHIEMDINEEKITITEMSTPYFSLLVKEPGCYTYLDEDICDADKRNIKFADYIHDNTDFKFRDQDDKFGFYYDIFNDKAVEIGLMVDHYNKLYSDKEFELAYHQIDDIKYKINRLNKMIDNAINNLYNKIQQFIEEEKNNNA